VLELFYTALILGVAFLVVSFAGFVVYRLYKGQN
jgi:hypothetical protein